MGIFTQMNNTATAVSMASKANTLAVQWEAAENAQAIIKMMHEIPLMHLASRRHPDPPIVYKQEVEFPELQVRGIWKKISPPKGPKPRARQAFTSWVWGGKLYISGGYNESTHFSDLWYALFYRYMSCCPNDLHTFEGVWTWCHLCGNN